LLRVTGGEKMSDIGLTAHRALDDAKAERPWLTELTEFLSIVYGQEKKKCVISLKEFRRVS